jgi:hypothetical protein
VESEHHFHHEAGAHVDETADEGGLLHGLAHAVHACAHAFAILSAALPAVGAEQPDLLLPETGLTPGDAPRGHPFRPPIG